MKVVLLGYMASGKSSIGRRLSKKINLPLIDLDNYIEAKEQLSIADIFKQKGEIYFRKIENIYLKELLQKNESFVLSLGGGTPCYANNMDLINQSDAISIYLKASVNKLANRLIKKKSKRPLVANLSDDKIFEFVGKHLFERNVFYDQAKIIVKTDGKTKSETTTEIIALLV